MVECCEVLAENGLTLFFWVASKRRRDTTHEQANRLPALLLSLRATDHYNAPSLRPESVSPEKPTLVEADAAGAE